MPKRGENIYKRKDGRWEGRYIRTRTAAGKAVYGYVYAHSYKEVRLKLQNAAQTACSLTIVRSETTRNLHFRVLTEEWFCHVKPQIKESTYRKYRNLWNSYICPELGNMCFAELTQDVLQIYCKTLLTSGGQEGKGLSAKTVSDTLSLIHSIFQYYGSRKFPVPCDTRTITIRQCTKEMRIFSLNEQKMLCRHIHSDLCIRNVGILVCLFTGIRVGEVCALKWDDISFSEKTMYIHQTMQRLQIDCADRCEESSRTKVIVTTPKSRCSIRTIPIPEELTQILQSVKGGASGYFLTGSEKKWVEPRTMQNHFKRLLKICNIADANYHALRHTFATRCVEVGFDIKSLSEILGHASVNITMNRYVHPSMQLKQANMQRLSELIYTH
ncbi:MAG: site-specific integrase [Dorea sp.]|nr:site-specific integrase [Dorea sp.]